MYRLSTDVGGTFTDSVLLDEETGEIRVSKVPSTPANPAIGTIEGIQKFGIPLDRVSFLVHGTTVVINALIEGKGAKTALITTKGFRDVLEIGRSNRPEMYNALYKKPRPLVPRWLRLEVTERLDPEGRLLVPLDLEELGKLVDVLKKAGVESVAVCLINAYANPRHEEKIGEILAEKLPGVTVSLSHQITRRYYEYERTSTTVQNAYVMPVVRNYLKSLEEKLAADGFTGILHIMQSNGGVMTSELARDIPIAMVESGPAAGAIGAAQLAGELGYRNVIAYDMGGTTAKTSIITAGVPETTEQYIVEGRPILLPVVDLREIGAGGGSIAWVDEAGALHVGPQSAGADPGPACYMRGGTQPTVTDANLQLGILDPEYFLGGEMEVSPRLAHEAIAKLASRFDLGVDEMALGIIQIVNTNMSGLLQSMTVKRGYDPREFALVAFGGAGPIHATAIAGELGIPTVIVPISPGVFSAWGMLMADLRHDFSQTYIRPLAELDLEEANRILAELEGRVWGYFRREHVPQERVVMSYSIAMRYVGQEHTLPVECPARLSEGDREALARRFDELHLRVYGHNAPPEPKEVVSFHVTGLGKVRKPVLKEIPAGKKEPPAEARMGTRRVYVGGGGYLEFVIYRREKLLAGNEIPGPAIIEEPTATTVVEKGQHCTVDRFGNLVISLNRGGGNG